MRFRVNFTSYKFCLNIPVDYAPQNDWWHIHSYLHGESS
jgi:hypothetical protein